MTRPALLLLLALVPGCAYYNGMYNANRLARSAEKAEREGRTFEATSLWGQVGVKADTMLARHGESQWADDAMLLRGKSYQRLGDCNSAVSILQELLAGSADSALVEEGSYLLGRCYQVLGNSGQASRAFARLITSADPARRREALYQHGHSLRLGGRYDEALAALTQTDDPRAAGERAAALAGAGRLDAALAVADSLIAIQDTAAPWDSILALLGRSDPGPASSLTDRLIAMPAASLELRAGWLLGDGERIGQTDPPAGANRIAQAVAMAPGGAVDARGRLLLLRLRMTRTTTPDSLAALRLDLEDLLQRGGPTGITLSRFDRGVVFVLEIVDSVGRGASAPDLRLFLAAETARDSLEMTRLAAVLFRRVVEEHPGSPYAAKALLALGMLESATGDSTQALLRERYFDNPYVLAARGLDTPAFVALEDSLLGFANALRRARTTTPARPPTPPASGGRLPQN